MEQTEYNIDRPKNELSDYLQHIQYERSLLPHNADRKDCKLKNSIFHRIKSLYNEATKRFPKEKHLWDEYFMFITSTDLNTDNSDVSAILDSMVTHHGDDVEQWMKYIKWERTIKTNELKLKNLLMRALHRHPESEDLHIEFMDIELSNHRNLPTQNVLDRTILLYNNARKRISSLCFLASVLDLLNKYKFSKPLQLTILEDMKSMYCNKELFWHILAQRELKGLPTFDEARNKKVEENKSQFKLQKVNILRCVKVYQGALSKINTMEMWTHYLNAMIELNNDTSTFTSLKHDVLGSAFKAAFDAKQISETHCVRYVDFTYTAGVTDAMILDVLEGVLTIHPTSKSLWECLIKFYIQKNDDRKVEDIFNTARTKLGDESISIWSLYMPYLLALNLTSQSNKISQFFLQVVKEPSDIFRSLKVESIECTALLFGIKEARHLLNFTMKNGVPCLEMCNKMANIEEMQIEPDIENWRNCLELACINYGQDNIDVWVNLYKFERKYGDSKNASNITERAISQLKPELVDTFIFTRDAFDQGIVVSSI